MPASRVPKLRITKKTVPPEWALLELTLLKTQSDACREFFDRYFDDQGYLNCIPRWGGNDGPDDAAENFLNWTILHALGGPDDILDMYTTAWEGHLRQYTEAKTTSVPLATDGMYYREFPVMFDWFHHGEWLSAFILQGLSTPYDSTYIDRSRRYAGLYMNEDPLAPNYDPDKKIIKSMFNGSRGPLLRKATALDWAGDPIELEGRFKPGHGERTFQEMLAHFKDYQDVVGDHPLNLGATTLAFNAYALTGESKYFDWLVEYVDAWVDRINQNNGIIPTNIGLDGSIGGECDGKWYGGTYGWSFTVQVPQTGEMAHRPSFGRGLFGFGNALLLTGNQQYISPWRNMLDQVNSNAIEKAGIKQYPHMYGDDGWYDFTDQRYSEGSHEIYYWSMDPKDIKLGPENRWESYINGEDPEYPVDALRNDFNNLRKKVQSINLDSATPDTRMSDDLNLINPATTDTLTQLMLGGLAPGRQGSPLHCRVRYFDPENRRAGLPEGVAALVERISADQTTLLLVNTDHVKQRQLIIQGGAYGEHNILSVAMGDEKVTVNQSSFIVSLAPGSGDRLILDMERYANRPSFSFPWI